MKLFKRFLPLFVLAIFVTHFVVSGVAFADDVPVSDAEFWEKLLAFIGGVKGMALLPIVAGLVQLVMLFFKTQMGDLAGIWKLVIVSGLNVVGAVLSQLVTGVPILSAVLNGAVLAAVSVFVNEIIKHFNKQFKIPGA